MLQDSIFYMVFAPCSRAVQIAEERITGVIRADVIRHNTGIFKETG
jgi:hypothetical protein